MPHRVTITDLLRGGSPSPYVEKPAGVDYRDGHLYVCDTGLNVVHDWKLTTGQGRRIGHRGEAVLRKPVDVAVSSEGTIFVADTERREVVAFDQNGALKESFRPRERSEYRPTSVAVDPSNAASLTVSDVAVHEVGQYALIPGESSPRGAYTAIAHGSISLHYPSGVATYAPPGGSASESVLLVSDALNARLLRYASGGEGETVLAIGKPGDRLGDLGHPKHLDVGPDGVIFAADAAFRCVHLFNQDGQFLMMLGGPEDRPGGTPMPLGVAIAESLPASLQGLIPPDFEAHYFLFVTNTVGSKRISLFAVGQPRR